MQPLGHASLWPRRLASRLCKEAALLESIPMGRVISETPVRVSLPSKTNRPPHLLPFPSPLGPRIPHFLMKTLHSLELMFRMQAQGEVLRLLEALSHRKPCARRLASRDVILIFLDEETEAQKCTFAQGDNVCHRTSLHTQILQTPTSLHSLGPLLSPWN